MEVAAAHEAFVRAQEDARFDEKVLFFPYTTPPPPTVTSAAFHPPNEPAGPDELSVFSPVDAQALSANVRHYRVVCWLGLPDPVLEAVVRHELEHVKQWKWGGGREAFQLAAVEKETMDHVGYRGLPANGQVYNLVPIELDANGAASAFVRRAVGDEQADRWAADIDPGLFRRRPAPEDYSTLPSRLLCHGAIWPGPVERVFRGEVGTPADFFDRLVPDGAARWRELREDERLEELRTRVAETVPSAEAIRAAASLEEAWAPAKTAIRAAGDRARELMGLSPTPV
jgi:hypothetical protein